MNYTFSMVNVLKQDAIRILTFLFLLLTLTSINAQTTKLTGKVVDADFGDPMIGANVFIDGTTLGSATDVEGNYSISGIEPGTYTVVYSMIGFAKKTVTGVVIKAGEIKQINVSLSTETYETDEVVITAKLVEDSEASLLIKRQKSISVSDAISAEQISRSGSGNAAEAVKQVVGASIVDGKYVYVRGLGERYSSTQLNGAELPSSDPDKKAFQLDLLPSNLLENITTIKTFTPDKPGNFSGGIVDIGTKNFPEKFQFKISMGTTFNSNTTSNRNYITYTGSKTDWLGYDDGARELPDELKGEVNIYNRVIARRDSAKAYELDSYANSFSDIMDFRREKAPYGKSFSISVGDNIPTGETSSFGYQGSFTYGQSFSYYDDGVNNRYSLNNGATSLHPELLANESKGTAETNMGGLFAFAYNLSSAHQLGGNIFYSRSGESNTLYQIFLWPHQFDLSDNLTHYNRVLGYKERDLVSYQVRGDHFLKSAGETKLEWSASFAQTSQSEPDLRFIYYSVVPGEDGEDDSYNIVGSNFDAPSRYFRELEDNSNTFKADLTTPFEQWSGLKSKFKYGGYYQYADRNFTENLFQYDIPSNSYINSVQGDLNALFNGQYSGVTGIKQNGQYDLGILIEDKSKEKNSYTSESEISAFYMMVELPIFKTFKFIGGARMEKTNMEVVSEDETKGVGRIETDDLLPSLNFIYNLNENMNLRAAATKTLARPNPRELAPFSSKQFIGDYELSGNPDLQRTLIFNYDLRYEWFMRPGEIVAVSLFYKEMDNPIEISMPEGATAANLIYQYMNTDKAILKGAEFELRTKLDYFFDFLSNFQFGANLSLVDSRIDIPQDEYVRRLNIDSSASKIRDLQGQSPIIANLDLAYVSYESGTSVNLHLNYFSERLARVSTGVTPDIYEQPAPRLDLTASQDVIQNITLSFGIKNILDPDIKYTYDFDGEEYIYSSYRKGVSYKFGISYKL